MSRVIGDHFACENPECDLLLLVDHVTLVTTAHVRRFCSMDCLVQSYYIHMASLDLFRPNDTSYEVQAPDGYSARLSVRTPNDPLGPDADFRVVATHFEADDDGRITDLWLRAKELSMALRTEDQGQIVDPTVDRPPT